MPIRMTGMNSGLQTDMIIQELVKGQKAKVDNAKKVHTSFQWKQDAWKDLNTKALKLHKMIDSMRWADAYVKKTSKVSNTAKASVVTGDTAVKGVQELQVNELAKTAYLTGGKITAPNGENTKLSTLMGVPANSDPLNFTVTVDGKEKQIELTGNSSIKDMVNQLKNVGLNANFDANNGRLFISSKTMGAKGDFSITANNASSLDALSALGINENDASQYAGLAGLLQSDGVTVTPGKETEYNKLVENYMKTLENQDKSARTALEKQVANTEKMMSDRISLYKAQLISELGPGADPSDVDAINALDAYDVLDEAEALNTDLFAQLGTKQAALTALTPVAEDEAGYDDYLAQKSELEGEIGNLQGRIDNLSYDSFTKQDYIDKEDEIGAEGIAGSLKDDIKNLSDRIADPETSYRADAKAKINADIAFAKQTQADMEAAAIANEGNPPDGNAMKKIAGQDAVITLNGAEFKSNTNTFTINGLTINAIQKTDPGETITITTEDDTEGIYDTIKNFIKEYNALINEMDRLYNADSARDYKPLTEEEKEAMSEKEIEDWEKKIKDSVLRRDSSLYDISSVMKNAMMGGVNVSGKNMHLSDFGIEALSYFLAGKNEKNAYHIAGDPDNVYSSGTDGTNKLKEWIAKDAKTVTDFFSGLSKNLFAEMDKIIMRTDNFKSFNSLYNDKQYKTDLTKYNNEIAKQEAKLTKMEDKYYKQYTAMEVALAKMQSNQSALSGLLGM